MIIRLKIIVTCLVLSCFYGVNAQKINQFDANGKRTGIWRKNYKSGNLRYTGEFVNGKEKGTFKFYDNRRMVKGPSVIKEFSLNSDIANVKFFTEKGKVKAEGKMKGKHRIGQWKYYFINRKPLSIENYKDGKLDGILKNFYSNGNLTNEVTYINGIKNGISKTYAEDGKLIEKVTYKNGILNGYAEFYDLKGKLLEKGTFINGKRADHDWNYYSEDGSSTTKRKRKTMRVNKSK